MQKSTCNIKRLTPYWN